jgi:hypothetical protein
MNFVGISILVILIAVVLCAPRRVALLGMMASVLYLTEGQQIQAFGFHMFGIRFLELAGFLRVMYRREFSFQQLNTIDYAFLLLYIYTTVVFLLRSSEDVAYQVGIAVDAFLCYFAFRGLIGNIEDFMWFLRVFLILLAPYTLLVLCESFTRHDLFAAMGAVPDGTWLRGNRTRCFGSFREPDTLGMFAASFLPLYVGLACIRRERKFALFGIILCLIIPWAANSGGAATAAGLGLLGWFFWRIRTHMRKVRWGIVMMLVGLALVMKAPIWFIFAKASAITGGDGWHRSHLIDVAYQHLSQWWFCGMPISWTSGWFAYTLGTQDQSDITNEYLSFGLAGGLLAMALFILVLVRAYSSLGKAMAAVRADSERTAEAEFLLWGLGATLTIHIVDWFGITYFDQLYVVWFMQLAAISTLCQQQLQAPVKVVSEAMQTEATPEIGYGNC